MDGPDEIQQEAHIRIVSKNLYGDGRQPAPYGVLDRQMVIFHQNGSYEGECIRIFIPHLQGVSQKDALCATCNQGLNECVGHFGYLDLALPVYHVGHFRATIQILQSICKVSSTFFLTFLLIFFFGLFIEIIISDLCTSYA